MDFRSVVSIGLFILSFYLITIGLYRLYKERDDKKWVSKVPYTRLVREVVLFTNDILIEKNIKRFPRCKICYHGNKKQLGFFDNTHIVVFINNHDDIPAIVSTVLHEINHFIQMKTDSQEYDQYLENMKFYGYDKHPLELDCLRFEKKWLQPCLKHLQSMGIISKKI